MIKTAGLTPRDLRLLVGVAFFAEILLGYFLLVDGPLTQVSRLQAQLVKTREGTDALRLAVAAREAERRAAVRQGLPTPLTPRPGENLSVAIQRYLNGEIVQSGASLVSLNVKPLTPEAESPAPGYKATASVEGSYEAIAKLVERIQKPEILLGVDSIRVRAGEEDAERLTGDFELSFYFIPAASEAPVQQTSPRP